MNVIIKNLLSASWLVHKLSSLWLDRPWVGLLSNYSVSLTATPNHNSIYSSHQTRINESVGQCHLPSSALKHTQSINQSIFVYYMVVRPQPVTLNSVNILVWTNMPDLTAILSYWYCSKNAYGWHPRSFVYSTAVASCSTNTVVVPSRQSRPVSPHASPQTCCLLSSALEALRALYKSTTSTTTTRTCSAE